MEHDLYDLVFCADPDCPDPEEPVAADCFKVLTIERSGAFKVDRVYHPECGLP